MKRLLGRRTPWEMTLLFGLTFSMIGCDLGHPPEDLGDALTAQESLSACGTEEGPLAGTCLEGLGGTCWNPQGTCLSQDGDPGVALGWESGHNVTFAPDLSDPQALNIVARDGVGSICFSGKSSLSADGSGTVQLFQGSGPSAELAGSIYTSTIGAVYISCSGLQVALSPGEASVLEQCLYGRGGGLCDFAAASRRYRSRATSQTGACEGASDCPSGAQCCEVSGGANYCAPVCFR